MALRECAATDPRLELESVHILLLCLTEGERPGHLPHLTDQVAPQVSAELGIRFHEQSMVIARGRVGTGIALLHARWLIYEERIPRVLIVSVDSLLAGLTIQACEERGLLLTSRNSDGFIPGEAAAAVLVRAPRPGDVPQLICRGLGFGVETATEDSGEPLRADGLVKAIRDALAEAGCKLGDLDFRITDISGTQYRFKEAALALSRILRKGKEEFDLWHPADCVGEVGAAIGGVMIAAIDAACHKGYSKGHHILFHLGNDDGKRRGFLVCGVYLGSGFTVGQVVDPREMTGVVEDTNSLEIKGVSWLACRKTGSSSRYCGTGRTCRASAELRSLLMVLV